MDLCLQGHAADSPDHAVPLTAVLSLPSVAELFAKPEWASIDLSISRDLYCARGIICALFNSALLQYSPADQLPTAESMSEFRVRRKPLSLRVLHETERFFKSNLEADMTLRSRLAAQTPGRIPTSALKSTPPWSELCKASSVSDFASALRGSLVYRVSEDSAHIHFTESMSDAQQMLLLQVQSLVQLFFLPQRYENDWNFRNKLVECGGQLPVEDLLRASSELQDLIFGVDPSEQLKLLLEAISTSRLLELITSASTRAAVKWRATEQFLPRVASFLECPSPPRAFSLAQLNMRLSQDYDSERFTRPFREQSLLDGIGRCDASIICLQDVGCTSAESEFHRDRISIWTARLGYGYCVANAAGQTFGNMTLFRLADFAYVSHRVLCFADELQSSGQLSESQLAHYACGSECALILELRHISTGNSVIIANASIDSAAAELNPDMQCLQIALLYRCIQLHSSAGLQPPRASAVLIACNMNSQPSEDAFQFATDAYPAGSPSVRCTRPNPALHASVPALHPETFQQSSSAFRLQMRSVYHAVNGMHPLITQARGAKGRIDAFYGCADYILIAENRGLVPIPRSTIPTPSLASVQCDDGCLPNGVFPSEHVPLGAHFQFLP